MRYGVKTKEFLKTIKSVDGIEERRDDNQLSFEGRDIFVLHPYHPSREIPKFNAYALYRWENFRGFKIAKSHYIKLTKLPIVDLGVLLNKDDENILLPTKSKLIELVPDLGYPHEDSSHASGRDPYSWMDVKEGWLFHTPLKSAKDIEKFFDSVKVRGTSVLEVA